MQEGSNWRIRPMDQIAVKLLPSIMENPSIIFSTTRFYYPKSYPSWIVSCTLPHIKTQVSLRTLSNHTVSMKCWWRSNLKIFWIQTKKEWLDKTYIWNHCTMYTYPWILLTIYQHHIWFGGQILRSRSWKGYRKPKHTCWIYNGQNAKGKTKG